MLSSDVTFNKVKSVEETPTAPDDTATVGEGVSTTITVSTKDAIVCIW
ncbi:hypothetical protein [Tenacibaculum sp. SZ-18]|nr:hypothetical protein [Tenacibaculum sp. SZ-18]